MREEKEKRKMRWVRWTEIKHNSKAGTFEVMSGMLPEYADT